MTNTYLRLARNALAIGAGDLACIMLRAALASANRDKPAARGAIMRALNYARRA